jgi:hypothetical protein
MNTTASGRETVSEQSLRRHKLRFDLEEDSTDREALADSKLEVQSEEMEVAKPTAVVY